MISSNSLGVFVDEEGCGVTDDPIEPGTRDRCTKNSKLRARAHELLRHCDLHRQPFNVLLCQPHFACGIDAGGRWGAIIDAEPTEFLDEKRVRCEDRSKPRSFAGETQGLQGEMKQMIGNDKIVGSASAIRNLHEQMARPD